jgi:hypothetical protein
VKELAKSRIGYDRTPPPEALDCSFNELRWLNVTRTDDDIIKRLVRYLVNCSEHDENEDVLEATVGKRTIYVVSESDSGATYRAGDIQGRGYEARLVLSRSDRFGLIHEKTKAACDQVATWGKLTLL